MKPNKVEQTLIIRENKSMVDEFKKNTTYNIVETRENAFLNVDIIEILREATEDSDTDAGLFDTDDEKVVVMKTMTQIYLKTMTI